MSIGLSDDAATSMRTSPSPGSGSGTPPSSGGRPSSETTAARISFRTGSDLPLAAPLVEDGGDLLLRIRHCLLRVAAACRLGEHLRDEERAEHLVDRGRRVPRIADVDRELLEGPEDGV